MLIRKNKIWIIELMKLGYFIVDYSPVLDVIRIQLEKTERHIKHTITYAQLNSLLAHGFICEIKHADPSDRRIIYGLSDLGKSQKWTDLKWYQ